MRVCKDHPARLVASEAIKVSADPDRELIHSSLPTWYISGCVNLGSSISLCP